VRAARNIAIIMLLALVVAVVPGGDNAARAIAAALSIAFLGLIAFTVYMLYRQNSFTFLTLDERQRALLYAGLGAIVLMIAGADELLETGAGLVVWVAVLGGALFAIYRVVTEARSSF
jgi:hypothetical protein